MNEREIEVLRAAARIIVLAREVLKSGKRFARTKNLSLSLAAYDDAVTRMNAPSVYDRINDPGNMEGEPKPPIEPTVIEDFTATSITPTPPIPEPETQALYRAYYGWVDVLNTAKADVERLRLKDREEDAAPDPELEAASQRLFRAQDVLMSLKNAIEDAMSNQVDDTSTSNKIIMNVRYIPHVNEDASGIWTEEQPESPADDHHE